MLHHEIAIHEEELLERDQGGQALLAGGDGVGEIKERQDGVEPPAADVAIDGAAVVCRAECDGGAAGLEIEIAGDEEQGIADGFNIEAAAVGVPEQAVFRVGGVGRFRCLSVLSA